MRRIAFISILFLSTAGRAFGQSFWIHLPKSSYETAPGAAVETALEVGFCQQHAAPVVLTANAPQGVRVYFQPRSVTRSQRVTVSIFADSTVRDRTVPVTISASDGHSSLQSPVSLQVHDLESGLAPARDYMDSALAYLDLHHPEIAHQYGSLRSLSWDGYWPFPYVLVVSHYMFLSGNWRIVVLWHIMIPPHNWKRVFVSNEELGVYWGLEIDTKGEYKEIPFRQIYHFWQDVTSVRPDMSRAPDDLLLHSYPNPAGDVATIDFTLTRPEIVSLKVYSLLGEEVATLVSDRRDAGDYTIRWDAGALPRGVYFYRLASGSKIETQKFVLTQ